MKVRFLVNMSGGTFRATKNEILDFDSVLALKYIEAGIADDDLEGGNESPISIKTKYESNADTNAFTDLDKLQLSKIPPNSDDYIKIIGRILQGDWTTKGIHNAYKLELNTQEGNEESKVTRIVAHHPGIDEISIILVGNDNFPTDQFIFGGGDTTDQDARLVLLSKKTLSGFVFAKVAGENTLGITFSDVSDEENPIVTPLVGIYQNGDVELLEGRLIMTGAPNGNRYAVTINDTIPGTPTFSFEQL